MSSTRNYSRIILVTGNPGSGKTTLIARLSQLLDKVDQLYITGFKTEEIRGEATSTSNHRFSRIGFDIVLLGTQLSPNIPTRSILARSAHLDAAANFPTHAPRLGQYLVNVPSFEQVAIPCLEAILNCSNSKTDKTMLCILDEIGKMELYSATFRSQVEKLIDLTSCPSIATASPILLATVPSRRTSDGQWGIALLDRLFSLPNVTIFEVTRTNRDNLVEQVYQKVIDLLGT